MKVTFFLDCFPNYSETFVLNQIIGLIDLGVDVSIIAIYEGDSGKLHTVIEQYKLIEKTKYLLPKEGNFAAKKLLNRLKGVLFNFNDNRVRKSLNSSLYGKHARTLLLPHIMSYATDQKTFKSDWFLAHFGTMGVVASKLRSLGLLDGKIATIFHGSDISRTETLELNKDDYVALFAGTELFLPISELWQSKLVSMGAASEKTFVCRMGIDINSFDYQNSKNELDELKIITVARLTEKKGIEIAIKCCNQLNLKGIKFSYTIVGNGPLLDSLVSLVESFNLQEKVSFVGVKNQDEIKSLLNHSNFFLLPSLTASDGDMEGIPVALMEGMSKGLPVVSTFHSGIPELIQNEYNGWLVPEGDFMALSDVFCNILDGKYSLDTIKMNARKTVEKDFNQPILNQRLCNLLSEKL